MPKAIEVADASLAAALYTLAAEGFRGSTTELSCELGYGTLSPTAAGQFANRVRSVADALAKVKVIVSFENKGNNKYIIVAGDRGYRKKAPLFANAAAPEVAGEPTCPKGASAGFDPTDARVIELNSDIVHFKSELKQTKAALEAASRNNGLFKAIVTELEPRIVAMNGLPPQRPVGLPTRDLIDEHLVIHLSDGHHDQVVHPHECGGLEDYNVWVSCRRAENYVDSILKWTQTTLSNFRFNRATVLAYGDHTSGEIHGAVERSTFRNQFRNSLAIGQLHALMLRDIAAYIPAVDVVYVPGNHGRRSNKKNYHGAWDNWDYLVAETARMYCRDLDNVSFNIPDAFAANVVIEGIGFQIAHGDDINSSMGIPWYGLQRRAGRLMALNYTSSQAARVRYFVCGHFHKPGTIGDMDGELIVNGPWPATDAYCFNRFSGFTEPQQLIHGVNEKYGVTWRLPIRLRSPDEKQGPKRYKIDLSSEEGFVKELSGT
jgi:hypothetical protein